ncbi:MAG: tRNA1(Val) (adenine(37)-N6)-methyltransferase [Alkalilacustris sp.]
MATTEDAFLDGRLRILQPQGGYRAATDPVLMAAAVPARSGQSVLDLGCGVGVAALCLGARVSGLRLAGLERQPAYAALARANGLRNALPLAVWEGCVSAPPAGLRAQDFDHVLANPPWFEAAAPAARDPGRDIAQRASVLPLAVWVATGLRRLRSGGYLTLILPAARLPEALGALAGRAAAVVRPIAARAGRPAGRVLVQARKGGRSPFVLAAPLVMHAAPRHLRDGEDLSDEATAILRDAAPLPMAPGDVPPGASRSGP